MQLTITEAAAVENRDRYVRYSKARYVGGKYIPENGAHYPKYRNIRIFVFPEGESVWANLANRRERPSAAYRRDVLPHILAWLPGFDPKVNRVVWSQRAGCSCPCSPGFVVRGYQGISDIYVNVSGEEHAPVAEAALAAAVMDCRPVNPEDYRLPEGEASEWAGERERV